MIPKAKLLLRVKLLPVLLCNLSEHTEIMFPKRYDFFRLSVFGTKAVKVEVLDVQETVKKDNAAELYKYL